MSIVTDTEVAIPVHEWFERRAAHDPNGPAVICGRETVTAGELDARANQLARRLRRLGVGRDDRVALLTDYTSDMIVASLAAIKAGAAYIALDASWPRAVLDETLRDCDARVLIASRPTAVADPFAVVALDADRAVLAAESTAPLRIDVQPEQLFSVVYTSGTSGHPKGVLVPVRSVWNRLHWMWTAHPYRPGDVSLLYRSHAAIGFTWDCFGPLLQGVPIVMAPAPNIRDVRELVALAVDGGVSHVSSSPGRWDAILDYVEQHGVRWPTLRLGRTSGEALRPETVRRWRRVFPHASLVNVYGSTECSSTSSHEASATPLSEPVPAGIAVPNVIVRILDSTLSPVAPGAVGEVCVGGACVARGYLNRPGLTAARFIPDPCTAEGGARLYRTGDLGFHDAHGALVIVGRRDHQVNVRGFRVELEAIESALRSCDGVRAAAVQAAEPRPGDVELTAYVVLDDGADWSPADLRARLRDRVADYMVPGKFVRLREMPLTPTGKIARQALAGSVEIADGNGAAAAAPTAPRTPTEEWLLDIWRRVLTVERIDVADDFFALGGHSLLAAQILSRVYEAFHVELPLDALFNGPNVRSLAQAIDRARPSGPR
jgi:amino acid adenylation domain-containing protein